jgi:SNF2 family DNA or RNA helicase
MMGKVKIDIDEKKSRYLLTGDVELLSKNRRAVFSLNYLNADFSQEMSIVIPYEEATRESIFEGIHGILEKFGLEEIRSEKVQVELDEYIEAEARFAEFSKKAEDIRNNKCNKKDLADFAAALEKEMSGRRLYPLQLLSAYHLAFSQNACNFSVPGAGKTSIVYGAYAYLHQLPENHPQRVDKILILGPLSSFLAWEDEYQECFGRKASSKRLSGGATSRDKTRHFYGENPSEITLISYQGVPSALEDITFFLKKNKVMVVLDEAHKIKNVDGGVWADAVAKISRYCKARVVLTGTPVPNGFQDLNNLFDFIYPGKNILGFKLYQLKSMSEKPDDSRIEELISNISPFFIRIRKSDLNLPKPIENSPVMISMGRYQREIYDFIDKSYEPYFQNIKKESSSDSIRGMIMKARLIRLMQAASNPSLLKKPIGQFYDEQGIVDDVFIDDTEILSKIASYDQNEVPAKFIQTGKLVKEIIDRGEKVVIWATFTDTIKELQKYLDSMGIKSKLLFGEVPVESEGQEETLETREKIIREFHVSNASFQVLIANPFAVAESISLHKVCHNAIYLERSYNATHYLQSKDRIHRYGLKPEDKINYYYLLSDDSIDGVIHEALKAKEQRMLRLIESEEIPLINMNMDYEVDEENDIKAIIRNYVAGRA